MASHCCLFVTVLLQIALTYSWTGGQKRLLLDHLPESACKDAQADITFLLDMSRKVGSQNFQLEKEFVNNFVEGIPLGHHKFQVGVGTYSSDFHEKIDFHSSSKQKTQLENKVNKLQYTPGGRNVYSALTNILRLYTLPYDGERGYASRIIFLITSGPSSSGASDIGMAESIRKVHNASIFVIQVGNDTDTSHYSKLVDNEKHIAVVKDFKELKTLSDTLFNTLCHDIIIGAHCEDKMAACPLWPCTGQIKTEHCPKKCGTCKVPPPWSPITTTNLPSTTTSVITSQSTSTFTSTSMTYIQSESSTTDVSTSTANSQSTNMMTTMTDQSPTPGMGSTNLSTSQNGGSSTSATTSNGANITVTGSTQGSNSSVPMTTSGTMTSTENSTLVWISVTP